MATAQINSVDTTWMLISTALVLLMTPALGFFYGGLVRSKNALNTLMMSFTSLGFVGLTWALIAYSLSFSGKNPWIGDLSMAFLRGVELNTAGPIELTFPHLLFMAFQGAFAIIAAALVSGAIVERMRFVPYLIFIVFWTILIYAPQVHWVWGGGFIGEMGPWTLLVELSFILMREFPLW